MRRSILLEQSRQLYIIWHVWIYNADYDAQQANNYVGGGHDYDNTIGLTIEDNRVNLYKNTDAADYPHAGAPVDNKNIPTAKGDWMLWLLRAWVF